MILSPVLVSTGCSDTPDDRAIRRVTSDHFDFFSLNSEMDEAVAYKRQHPHESHVNTATCFGVASSTLQDHVTGTHTATGPRSHQNLSFGQEETLLDEIMITPTWVSSLPVGTILSSLSYLRP